MGKYQKQININTNTKHKHKQLKQSHKHKQIPNNNKHVPTKQQQYKQIPVQQQQQIQQYQHQNHQQQQNIQQYNNIDENNIINLSQLSKHTLKYMQQLTYSPTTIPWQSVKQLLNNLNGICAMSQKDIHKNTKQQEQQADVVDQDEQNMKEDDVKGCIVMFNCLKNMLMSTFGTVNGIKDNRIYAWVFIMYSNKIGYIISNIQDILQKIEKNNIQNDDNNIKTSVKINKKNNNLLLKLTKYVCYGIFLTQILLSLIQFSNKGNTSNRIYIPQIYRFVLICIQSLTISNIFKYSNCNLDVNILKDTTTKVVVKCSANIFTKLQQIQHKNEQFVNKRQQNDVIDNANSKKNKKKNKQLKNKQLEYEANNYYQLYSLIIVKLIQQIKRSFKLCKKNVIQKTKIISSINNQLKKIVQNNHKQQEQVNRNADNVQLNVQNDFGETDIQNYEQLPLSAIIQSYLKQIQKQLAPKIQEKGYNLQQIDQQNKIIRVKELTPRFVEDQPNFELKKLRLKKKKLTKKIQSDARTAKFNKLQEMKVKSDVKAQRIHKKQKKDIFVMQKQTEQAKKQHNKAKKIKQIQKSGGNKTAKGKLGKFSQTKKIRK